MARFGMVCHLRHRIMDSQSGSPLVPPRLGTNKGDIAVHDTLNNTVGQHPLRARPQNCFKYANQRVLCDHCLLVPDKARASYLCLVQNCPDDHGDNGNILHLWGCIIVCPWKANNLMYTIQWNKEDIPPSGMQRQYLRSQVQQDK